MHISHTSESLSRTYNYILQFENLDIFHDYFNVWYYCLLIIMFQTITKREIRTAYRTRNGMLLDSFHREQFCHLSYRLQLVPFFDFHWHHLKKFIVVLAIFKRWWDHPLINVQNCRRSEATDFFEAGILQLVPRHDTWFDSRREYTSKSSLWCADFSVLKFR